MMQTRYCNTDLDLTGPVDHHVLVQHLEANHFYVLHVAQDMKGMWSGSLELKDSPPSSDTEELCDAELSIVAMLDIAERLEGKPREIWKSCTKIEFNVGFDCGEGPWAFNRAFSRSLLRRMADAGAGLRITMYPSPREQNEPSDRSTV